MFCGQYRSRRRLGCDLHAESQLAANIWRLCGVSANDFCHRDTLNNFMEQLPPEELEKLIAKAFNRLRLARVLDLFRYSGTLNAAVDATQQITFKQRHCPHCTHQTKDGVTTYFHNVLAAKLVAPNGLIVPLAFEFIENPDGAYDKQDCELKAYRRLVAKIRQLYPRLRLTILADGLYADQITFNDAEAAGWNFLISLTDAKLPTVSAQLPKTGEPWSGQRRARYLAPGGQWVTRTVRWQTPVVYRGQTLHVLKLEEHDQQGKLLYHNQWISNLKPHHDNALDLAQTGRLRWKIENEGTNTQKNGGYELEHAYGRDPRALKNYYLILQLAQMLNDLVRLSDVLAKLSGGARLSFARAYGSVMNFAEQLRRSWALRDQPRAGPLDDRCVQLRLARD